MPIAMPGKRVIEEGRRLSACFSPRCCPARMPLKSTTFKKMKLRPRSPGDQDVTMLYWVEKC